MGKNEISLLDREIAKTSVITENLSNALALRSAKHIETKIDSDGKEYLSATFALKAPTKKASQLVVNDMELATSIERLYNFEALGEVSSLASCKEMSNLADTDAKSLGFDTVPEMLQAIFAKGKSTLANYQRIGRYFVNDDYSLKGAIPQETSISLLNQLLSYVKHEDESGNADISNVEALFKYGIITPYMKQADYKKILAILGKIETSKELKDMSDEEVEELKKAIKEELAPKKKEDKKTEEKTEEKSEESIDDKDYILKSGKTELIVAYALARLKDMKDCFEALELTEEEMTMVETWSDNLYISLNERLG